MNPKPLDPGSALVPTFPPSHTQGLSDDHPSIFPNFLYLLPPCLLLFAVDAVVRYTTQRAVLLTNADKSSRKQHEIEPEILEERIRFTHSRIRDLNQKLKLERMRSDQLSGKVKKQRNFAIHRDRLHEYYALKQSRLPNDSLSHHLRESSNLLDPNRTSPAFRSLCERLIFQHEIWKQKKELEALRRSHESIQQASASNAFQTLCNALILSHEIWKQQKEKHQMMAEADRMKRSRVAAIKRAAKQMVLDVRKERLTEEFVKDLIEEVEGSKKAISSLRTEHEQEITELAEVWKQECRNMTTAIERLKLSQASRLIEQELSNEMESDLIEQLTRADRKAEMSEERSRYCFSEADSRYPHDETGSDPDRMSSVSTNTYVGSGGDLSPSGKLSFGKKKLGVKISTPNLRTPYALKSSTTSIRISSLPMTTKRIDPGPYEGFSFNPLYFGVKRDDESRETVLAQTTEDLSVKLTRTQVKRTPQKENERLKPSPKTGQWRI